MASILRLAVVAYTLLHLHAAWFFSRGSEMGFLARSVIQGRGLSSLFGPATGPTAIIAPGYPLLVSAVFALLGTFSGASALCLMLLQVGCNVVTVWLIYKLGCQIACERAAFFAALFWTCSLPLIWMPTIFWETSFSTMLLLGFVAIMLSAPAGTAKRFWFVCGLVCGTAGVFNPALLPSLFAITLCTLLSTARLRWKAGVAVLLGFLLVYSAWPVRNAKTLHALVLTRTTVGLELWLGNHPGSTGFLDESLFPTYNRAEFVAYQQQGELRYTANKGQLARRYIRANPRIFLHLSMKRVLRFWAGSGNSKGSPLFVLHAALTSLLGFSGLYLLCSSARRKTFLMFSLPLLLFPLPYYFTHAEFRYRLVVDPLLTILGAKGLEFLFATWTKRAKSYKRKLYVSA